MGKTLYDILEVSPSASPEAIAVAHKRLTEKYHPEHPRNQDNPDAFNLYKAVNDAFKTLSHPELRQRYDQRLDTEARAEAAPPSTSRLGTWLAGLLFAFPALRRTMPDAPPIGVTIDIVVFLWTLLLALLSAFTVAVAWWVQSRAVLLESTPNSESGPQ